MNFSACSTTVFVHLPLIKYINRQAIVIGLLFTFQWPVFASDITELLNNMSSADDTLNYQGVFVLRKADRMMSMRVSHAADENGIRERLESLNGESKHVIRSNAEVLSIYPERGMLVVSDDTYKAALHPTLPENLDKLQSYYQIERQPDDRIANHRTAVLRLSPKDKHRYGYRYWVDANTGVLLRCDLTDQNDAVIEQMMFTQLDYIDALPDEHFNYPGIDKLTRKHLSENRTALQQLSWQVTDLPAGFMLTRSSSRDSNGAPAMHLVYSDGLASVSVFVEHGKTDHHYLAGATNMGALNAYGMRHGEHYITVMGEVPATTVKQIAASTVNKAGSADAIEN